MDEIELQGNKQTGGINTVACSAAHNSNENPFHAPPSTEKEHSEIILNLFIKGVNVRAVTSLLCGVGAIQWFQCE